jgi:hypothetical protein
MNSLTLRENGFSECRPLKGLSFVNVPYNRSCVFVIIDTSLTGKPASDIIYIGKSKKPAKRIFGGYLSGFGGKTTRKINAKLFEDGYIEKTGISWVLSDKPKALQSEVLGKFMVEHGGYPLWNASKKSKKASKKLLKLKKPQAITKPAVKTPKPRIPARAPAASSTTASKPPA